MSLWEKVRMRRAGGLDSAFLALEARGHPLHVMAVMALDPSTVPGGYSFESLRDFVGDRLCAIPPLRQKLVSVPFGVARPRWVEVDVDVDAHVHRVRFDGGTLADVARYAAELDPVPLDRNRPLWAMHILEGLSDGTVAVVSKVHHALMDGVAGMQFMANMFSLEPEAEPVIPVGVGDEHAPGRVESIARAIPELISAPARFARALISSTGAARRMRSALRHDATLRLPGRAPRIAWNGPLGNRRAVAMTSLPLGEVQAIGRVAGATVNDVVLAVLGGACREYLATRGQLPDRPLLAAVPVSVRDPRVQGAANAVSLMFTSLATDIADPRARLAAVHTAAADAKHLHDAIAAETFTAWLEVASPIVFAAAARVYLGLHLAAHAPPLVNLLVSNVPGPPVALYFAGARLCALYPLGPVYDGVGLNVTVVSSAHDVGIGFVTSPDVLDDVNALAVAVTDEFTMLRDAIAAARDTA